MNSSPRSIFLLVIPILAGVLACNAVTPWEAEKEAAELLEIPGEFNEEITGVLPANDECNGTEYIHIDVEKTKDLVNEFNTELYEYDLHIKNTHPSTAIYLLGLKHNMDVYQNIDQLEWTPFGILDPGEIDVRSVYKNIYHEKDAEGPSMYMIVRLAGVIKNETCQPKTMDEKYLSEIAKQVIYQ